MPLVDDHLALSILQGRRNRHGSDGVPWISWGFHFRLVRAVLDMRSRGRLSSGLDVRVLGLVVAPPSDMLQVIDPRHLTVTAARLMTRYRLSLVGAELLSAGIVLGTSVHVADGNVGRSWSEVAAAEGIDLRVEPVDAPE